jgi:hypothetical protein
MSSPANMMISSLRIHSELDFTTKIQEFSIDFIPRFSENTHTHPHTHTLMAQPTVVSGNITPIIQVIMT